MSHTMRREEVLAFACASGDCEHDPDEYEIDDKCPTWEADTCAECTDAAWVLEGDLAGAVTWPCPESGASGEGSDA